MNLCNKRIPYFISVVICKILTSIKLDFEPNLLCLRIEVEICSLTDEYHDGVSLDRLQLIYRAIQNSF